ncbi:MAG: hypothetical protein WDZ82_01155 [Candidatus Paceibacterota bacterium]
MIDTHPVLIFGGGEMGQALTHLVNVNESPDQAIVFDVNKNRSKCSADELREVLPKSRIIFISVPSHAIEHVTSVINELRSTDQPVVALTKGMTRESDRFTGEVLREELGESVAVLTGPMLAEEISGGLPTQALCAGSKDAYQELRDVLPLSQFELEYTPDIIGASVCGLLKNIYSIGFGIADGLELGGNFRGLLATTALSEMMSIVERFGGERATALTAAGIGDLIATVSSSYSNNYAAGLMLARRGHTDIVSEGRCSMKSFARRFPEESSFALLSNVKRIILEEQSVDHFRDYLMRTAHV